MGSGFHGGISLIRDNASLFQQRNSFLVALPRESSIWNHKNLVQIGLVLQRDRFHLERVLGTASPDPFGTVHPRLRVRFQLGNSNAGPVGTD